MLSFIHQPYGNVRLGNFLSDNLQNTSWTTFRAAIAFVKGSGVQHIQNLLADFSRRATVKISIGIDQNGSSLEGIRGLLDAVSGHGEIYIFHNENQSTFHPKVYVFKNDTDAYVLIGSGNLTQGGLYTNYEASLFCS